MSGPKDKVAKYRSENAVGLEYGNNELVYDHSIPFIYLKDTLLSEENLRVEQLKSYLEKYTVACLITKEDDRFLNENGLNRKMPKDWDQTDPLARYKAVGIKIS